MLVAAVFAYRAPRLPTGDKSCVGGGVDGAAACGAEAVGAEAGLALLAAEFWVPKLRPPSGVLSPALVAVLMAVPPAAPGAVGAEAEVGVACGGHLVAEVTAEERTQLGPASHLRRAARQRPLRSPGPDASSCMAAEFCCGACVEAESCAEPRAEAAAECCVEVAANPAGAQRDVALQRATRARAERGGQSGSAVDT